MYANHEREDYDTFVDKLNVKWLDGADQHKLLVQTKLNTLVELVAEAKDDKAKEQIRHDLRLLKEFLKILDDHRLKTQGTDNWHFTLRLWSRSTQRNLAEFEREWEHQKLLKLKTRQSTANVTYEATVNDYPLQGTGSESIVAAPILQNRPLHNLPVRCHTAFIGSELDLTKLLKLLTADNPASLISIEGVGGIGKTTLVLETAHRCRLATQNRAVPGVPTFDAIIFVSAKSQHFLGSMLAPRLKIESNLQDIFRTIFRTLDLLDSIPPEFNQQVEIVRACLAQQQTLLIIDNFETLQDQEYVLSFLSELPSTVKVVLTSRVRLGVGTAIFLGCLSFEDSLSLIQHFAQEKDVLISPDEAQKLYQQSGGLPLAIAYGMGQIAAYGVMPEGTSAYLVGTSSHFMQYCFAEAVQQIQGQAAYFLLMTMALFPQSVSHEALEFVAFGNVAPRDIEAGLATLYKLSLVESRHRYYDLHSLTRHYVSAELSMHPDFEQEARNRLVIWYLNFLQPYGKRNWRDWQEFSSLEQEWENLREVMAWCRAQERYDDFKQFWQQLKGYTQFYGHWHERLNWMDWLMVAARAREDWETLADALYHTSRTLYLFHQPEQTQTAINLNQQAWELAQTHNPLSFQVDLMIHQAALCSQQQQFDQAVSWLNQAEGLFQEFSGGHTTHQWVDIDYYKAEICLQRQEYQQAKQLYTEALKKAEEMGWQRAVAYTKGWLAVVAIAQKQFSEAEVLLNFVLLQARQHHDKRCLSFCQNYLAILEKERGNLSAAEHWAQSAKGGFNQLNMQHKVSEIENLFEQ